MTAMFYQHYVIAGSLWRSGDTRTPAFRAPARRGDFKSTCPGSHSASETPVVAE